MKGLRDPQRLRDLDPQLARTIQAAHAHGPTKASIEALVRAVEASSGVGHGVATSAAKSSAGSSANLTSGAFAVIKTAAVQVLCVAAVASGVWWARSRVEAPRDARAPLAPSTIVAAPSAQLATRQSAELARPREAERQRATSAAAAQTEAAATAIPTATAAAAGVAATPGARSAPQVRRVAPKVTPAPSTREPALAAASVQSVARVPDERTTAAAPARVEPGSGRARWSDAGRNTADRSAALLGGPGPKRAASRVAPARRVSANDAALVAPELELLEEAQQALRSSPTDALVLTERHRQEYPRGRFVQEREQIAIEALFDAGRLPAMRERARSFLVRYPKSAHATRVRHLLDATR